ncbi:hypothetical protein KsCSTR_00690 [Candidatus Kuenenia stuttgartiensis]|uniref:Uncharacterized protein n=1 Tax=Kuenenia stuttgartiensis TaxID=174633 RepID=Q1PV66_KUEST|nr:hypothetical protein KsCSTR_00690 [Candidatus Kuenenia stuttgartiensis]CAJ71125.1 unknown protein [Candidatus Kuenenia stuttgartiensis]
MISTNYYAICTNDAFNVLVCNLPLFRTAKNKEESLHIDIFRDIYILFAIKYQTQKYWQDR